MNWYYASAGKQAGPVTDEQLQELAHAQAITDDTLVWHEGMAGWAPYQSVKPAPPAPEPVLPGTAAPTPSQPAPSPLPAAAAHFEYAGFWIRFVAKFLDGLIIVIALLVPAFIVGAMLGISHRAGSSENSELGMVANMIGILFQLAAWIVSLVYSTFFVGKYGATPGKMICGLKVIKAGGERPGYGLALGRVFAEILSKITCYIGYIMAGFDSEKRALHDHVCSTRVIYK